jgi:peptide/nickel transport system ATP-binding protein
MANEIIKDNDLALDIKNLTIHYEVDGDVIEAVNDISLQLKNGRTLGLVGETGAGKSSTALAILKMIPDPPGIIKSGSITVCGHDIMNADKK